MKNIFIAISVFLGVIGTSFAQSTVKMGHINSQELMMLMPESQTIRTEIAAFQKSLEVQMNSMREEYQSKVADYQANESTWSDLIKESKEAEIGDFGKRIEEFQQSAQSRYAAKEQSLIEPLIKKAQDAIDVVAKANGYTYVFDTGAGAVIVYPDGDNLLPLVKKHLGIQ